MAMDCTSPSALIGANWAAGALPALSLDASLAAVAAADVAVDHLDLDHSREGARNVLKFGGTSVGSPARLQGLVGIVCEERARVVAVVVSAMGHSTDHLLEAVDFAAKGEAQKALEVVDAIQQLSIDNALETQRLVAESLGDAAQEIEDMTEEVVAFFKPLRELLFGISLLQEKTAAALDTVLSFGERMSATIVAKLLTKAGVKAFFLDAREWLTTDATYGCAVVAFEESTQKLKELSAGWESQGLPVITGFIGRARPELGGRTTTLGRNGSDYTATIVGAALGADYVVINTDISGVMTADPRIVERAVALSHLNHHEALELAVYGTRMFHARTMVPLIKAGVTMLIRNTMDPNGHGTYISSADHTGKAETCTTSLENLAMLEVRTRIIQDASLQVANASSAISENIGARITKALEARRIPVWLSIRGAHGQAINVVIPRDCESIARDAIHEELTVEIESQEIDPLNVQSPVTMLSIVAEDFTSVPYNQTKFFGALADAGISVLAVGQGTSSRSLSCVIRGEDTKVAVRRVHDAFNVDHVDASIVLLGCNHITHEVIAQLQKQQELYRQQHKARVKIVGFGSNCCKFEFNARGFTFEELLSRIEQCKKNATPHNAGDKYAGAPSLEQLDALQDMPIPMLIDCSGQSSPKDLYAACLERGIHVVVSNARSVCDLPPTASRESIAATSRTSGRAFLMYTSTIGASLPVIDTLGNILRTGDRVLRIETGLSGSMGYVTNEVMNGASLSSAMRDAFSRGYCERDPREDLAGKDVVAKIIVLARALGVRLQARAIKVEPLVPREILDAITWNGNEPEAETICEALKAYDAEFRAKFYDKAVAQGKRLRYVASIDLTNFPKIEAEIKPAIVDETHPAFYARGNEIAFGFSTHQHQPNPLVLKGSGSGATAGATGVLRDVVTILYTLQGKNLHV